MAGDGEDVDEQRQGPIGGAFELPPILARLDSDVPTEQRAAVDTIRDHVDDHPDACMPTIPKLRALLERPASELDGHDDLAYCLAELATESAADVAPSTDEIVSFVTDQPRQPATAELLRCLTAVAAERPDALVDHVDALAPVVAERSAVDDCDCDWGLYTFALLANERPAALTPAVTILSDVLATDPHANGVTALATLGRIARSGTPLPSLGFVDHAVALVDHEDDSLRTNALGCLADTARHYPTAVESARPRIATALESQDPNTRANAAIALARIAAGTGTDGIGAARGQLLALLDDEHAHVRLNACLALGYGGVEAARERLAKLARTDPDREVRERAAWARDRLRNATRASVNQPPVDEA